MTDSPISLDGAVVRFLLRVVDRFEGIVSDPDALLANLKAVGLDDSAVTQYRSFLSARANDVSKLSTDLPKLLTVIESSNPDLASLITPVKDLWTVVTGLVNDAPRLAAPQMPQAPISRISSRGPGSPGDHRPAAPGAALAGRTVICGAIDNAN